MKTQLNRRHLLRGAGALIALPALESIGFRRFASAASTTPRRPRQTLRLSRHRLRRDQRDLVPRQREDRHGLRTFRGARSARPAPGLILRWCRDAPTSLPTKRTGGARSGSREPIVIPCPARTWPTASPSTKSWRRQLGRDTRFSSIQLNSSELQGHGPGLSLAWDQRGKPVAGENDPVQVFHKLFSADDLPLEQRQAAIAESRSVLDAVLGEAKRVQRGLSKTDTDKLDEYFQGIRDIETRLKKDEAWLDVPKAKAPLGEPEPGLKGKAEIEIMQDLIVAALQTDSTRSLTYRMPGQSLLQSLDLKPSAHNVSHYSPGPRMEASKLRDKTHSELLARLIDKLKATKEVDGSSLFDHTAVAFGSNISSIHYLTNCPTVLTGGGASLKLGQHLVLPKDTPLCNVWLTMLQGLGINALRHGDSTGVVKELQT